MKRLFIIHGWGGKSGAGCFVWLKKELTTKGFKVYAPVMPDSKNPKIETWAPYLKKIVENPDKETYFIGHCIGCQTILRYLEALPEKTEMGLVFFVAGWFNLKNLETEEEKTILKPLLKTTIDFGKVRPKLGKIFALFSDDDPYVHLEDSKIFKEKLGAKIVIENNRGRYIEDETKEIPILLKEVLNNTK